MGPISTHGAVWVVDLELDVSTVNCDSVRFCSPLCGWSAVSVSGLVVPPHDAGSLWIMEPSPGLYLSRDIVISA